MKKTVEEIFVFFKRELINGGIKHGERDARWILEDILSRRGLHFSSSLDLVVDEDVEDCVREALERRLSREPWQYIVGNVDFLDCSVDVNSSVLIPRQETEILADLVVKELQEEKGLNDKILWDLCCGSGCIGIAIKKALPTLTVLASDISSKAAERTSWNAEKNFVDIDVVVGDFVDALEKTNYGVVDFLICNPPYVSIQDYYTSEDEVKNFEPTEALVAAEDGLYFYRVLSEKVKNFVRKKGKIWLEVGIGQVNDVKNLFASVGDVFILKDLGGEERFVKIYVG